MTSMKPTIVNIKLGHTYDIYCGRAGKGEDGYLGNPFVIGEISRRSYQDFIMPLALVGEYVASRALAIALHDRYLKFRCTFDTEFAQRVLNCRGKVLGCFCAPQPCHADNIVKLIESMKCAVCNEEPATYAMSPKEYAITVHEENAHLYDAENLILCSGCAQ